MSAIIYGLNCEIVLTGYGSWRDYWKVEGCDAIVGLSIGVSGRGRIPQTLDGKFYSNLLGSPKFLKLPKKILPKLLNLRLIRRKIQLGAIHI